MHHSLPFSDAYKKRLEEDNFESLAEMEKMVLWLRN